MRKRSSARRYRRRHTSRLKPTTVTIMLSVPANNRGKSPSAVARAMMAPMPVALSVRPPKDTYSETMLAFHAPPLAVMAPVTMYGNNAA